VEGKRRVRHAGGARRQAELGDLARRPKIALTRSSVCAAHSRQADEAVCRGRQQTSARTSVVGLGEDVTAQAERCRGQTCSWARPPRRRARRRRRQVVDIPARGWWRRFAVEAVKTVSSVDDKMMRARWVADNPTSESLRSSSSTRWTAGSLQRPRTEHPRLAASQHHDQDRDHDPGPTSPPRPPDGAAAGDRPRREDRQAVRTRTRPSRARAGVAASRRTGRPVRLVGVRSYPIGQRPSGSPLTKPPHRR
jgi:hypothetical protein